MIPLSLNRKILRKIQGTSKSYKLIISNHISMVDLWIWLILKWMYSSVITQKDQMLREEVDSDGDHWLLMSTHQCRPAWCRCWLGAGSVSCLSFSVPKLMISAEWSWRTHTPFAIMSQSMGSKLQCCLCSTASALCAPSISNMKLSMNHNHSLSTISLHRTWPQSLDFRVRLILAIS